MEQGFRVLLKLQQEVGYMHMLCATMNYEDYDAQLQFQEAIIVY